MSCQPAGSDNLIKKIAGRKATELYMNIGLSVGNINWKQHIEFLKKVGVDRTFIMSDVPQFDEIMTAFKKNNIICETLHSPLYKLNDMWLENDEGDKMLKRLIECVDQCVKYGVPTMIVHLSGGRPMPPITERGIERYDILMDYSIKNNINIAYENSRYLENLELMINRHPRAFFCWDCGHENCFTTGIKHMSLFGKRVGALHIHDNPCTIDTDSHLIPFDGNIDFNIVAKDLADSGYTGTLMLEITKDATDEAKEKYKDISVDEYYQRAADAARKLTNMVEYYKNK